MTGTRTFVELFLGREVSFDDIDDYVENWNNEVDPEPLHTYLGMSKDEYKFWVEKPEECRSRFIDSRSRLR